MPDQLTTRPLALLTGVGRSAGIAAGIARQLARDGWDLALNSWAPYDQRMPWGAVPTGLEELARQLTQLGAQLLHLPADLGTPTAPGTLFHAIAAAGRRASALVLAHCESVASGVLDTTVESFDRHYAVNVRASWLLIREFALQAPAEGGRLVALTSDAILGEIPYGSTKAALDRIVLASARELADRRILANVLNPGPIDTGWMTDATRQACLQRQPTGRLGTLADIGHYVAFLLSTKGAWINGQLLKADGGFSA